MFKNIKERITAYFQLKLEIIRLELIERLVNVMGYMIFILLVIFLAFTLILFFGLGLAEWIGDLLQRRYAGYFIMGGLLLVGLLLTVWKSSSVIKFFANKFVTLLTASTSAEEKESSEEEDENS